MYDTLLDHDLEEETAVAGVVTERLTNKDLDVDEDSSTLADSTATPLEDVDPELGVDGNEEPEELLDSEDTESWSDDPVRMYLTQMGEIPLLTRKEEIALAHKIEITRAAFRRKLLACDYVIRSAVKVLTRVNRGELPFDRTVQVSVTDRL